MLRLQLAKPSGAVWCLVLLVLCAPRMHAQDGSVQGLVVDAESGRPLPYSAVTIVAAGIERFSDDSGRFVLAGLPPRQASLRIRHIGYAPKDIAVEIGSGQRVDVRVELRRIAVTLAALRVEASQACVEPGRPRPDVDSALATVFQQLEQNAQQYRLITTHYPFESTVRQYFAYSTTAGSAPIREATSIVRSDGGEHYKRGEIIVQHGLGRAVAIPTLAVFTERDFLEAHCFRARGLESLDGRQLLRIDFQASQKIDSPDLDGSIYLDPASFVIRRSEIRVSNLAHGLSDFDSISMTSRFEEIFPGVPIVAEVDGFSRYAAPRVSNGERLLGFTEHQRDVQLRFLRGQPRTNEDAANHTSARAQAIRHLDRLLGLFDGETGEPIAGAEVRDSASGLTAKTTATGTVSLAFLPSSHGVLQVSAAGYEALRTDVALSFTDTVPVTLVAHRVPRPSASGLVPGVRGAMAAGSAETSRPSRRRTRVRIVYTATGSSF